MNRKITLSITALLVVIVILFSQSPVRAVIAQKIPLKDILKIDVSIPPSKGEVVKDHENSRSVDQKQASQNDNVIGKANKLIGKAEKAYLSEGWLHISSTTEAVSTLQTVLPDGSPIPTKWTDDLWVLLDNKGNAIKAVSIQDTGDPKTSQVSKFENGYWSNITLGMVVSSEPESYRPTLDGGLLDTVLSNKDIVNLSEDTVIKDGRNLDVFTTLENLKNPIQLGKDNKNKKEVYGSVHKFYFAQDTGLPVLTEDYTVNSDGSLALSQQILIDVIEKADSAPENILNYFAQ